MHSADVLLVPFVVLNIAMYKKLTHSVAREQELVKKDPDRRGI